MKAGTFRAGQAKAAAKSFQVADHSGLTAYTSGEIGPQTVAIAELVTTHEEHWINGYDLGQQQDGRKWRHPTRTPFASSASVRIITTPLAKYGDKVVEIPEGDWIYQKRSADLIPDYRTLLLSIYSRKVSASNGTLALDWAIDEETLTVTSATVDTITDSSKSWGVNDYQNMYILVGTGDGTFQHRLIASNTATVLTLDSDLGLILSEGDAVDIIDWASPAVRRIDELTGAVVSSATVRAYADWERFYVVLRPTSTFNWLYSRIRSSSGTIWADGAKLEKASKLESGISTAATATTLTDSNRGWVDDSHIGRQVIILDGDDVGDCQTITDNDQTSLTAAFAVTPSENSTYVIIPANANLRPTPYLDLGQISASFYEASMYDLETGTLLVGGGLSNAPRIVVEDTAGKPLLKMGDYGDFKGIKFVNGAGASFEGGSIIMRADQGHEDADERIKMSYRGIEGWISDDVRKWALFTQGAGFEFLCGTSPLQARLVMNDSDGFAAYTAEGRKWWGVRPQVTDDDINYWWVGFPEGNWASFTEANGLQVHGGAIVEGTMLFAGLDSGIIDRLFDSGASSDAIQAWVHANDVTLIDGGKIYTNSVTASQIAANTITAAEIAANTITAAKIAAGTITAAEIAAGTITAYQIATGTITAAELAAGSVDTAELAANAVTAAKIAAGTITAAEIAAGTITAAEIAANTITASKLAAGSVDTSELAANAVTAAKIAANIITAAKIAANTITAAEIAASTITANELNVATLSAITANLGAVTAGSIVVGSTNKLWLNEGGDGKLSIGGAVKNSAPFRVGPTGAFTATNANITGSLYSSVGTIGGFTLAAGTLTGGSLVLDSANGRVYFGTTYFGWSGSVINLSGPLVVDGGIQSLTGTIQAYNIVGHTMVQGDAFRINQTPASDAQAAGTHTITINCNGTSYKLLAVAA